METLSINVLCCGGLVALTWLMLPLVTRWESSDDILSELSLVIVISSTSPRLGILRRDMSGPGKSDALELKAGFDCILRYLDRYGHRERVYARKRKGPKAILK